MSIGISEIALQALQALLAILLVVAMVTDWRRRSIDNWLTLCVALMAPLWWWTNGLSLWPDIGMHVLLSLIVFAAGLGLFAIGAMGGGDVKLLAGLGLWIPGLSLLWMLILMSIVGGVLTLAMLVHHKVRRLETPLEIPYGLAISFAALWVIVERNLNHFV